MTLYRVTLRLQGPLGSPPVGPMLFGQLCWIVAEHDGPDAMPDWLDPDRMWRLSDALPQGYLPKPLARPRILDRAQMQDAKQRKKAALVSREAWLAHRAAWDENRVPVDAIKSWPEASLKRAHNTIDRQRGTVAAEGGLHFAHEDWRFTNAPLLDLYVETGDAPDRIERLLGLLGEAGFGRDASTGRGRFMVEGVARDDALADLPGATRPASIRHVSLSRGVLTPATMQDARWRVAPHFGRTGPQISLTGHSPFKRPVLLMRPGASFQREGVAGRWLTGLHPDRPEIGLNGFHLSIPFAEAA